MEARKKGKNKKKDEYTRSFRFLFFEITFGRGSAPPSAKLSLRRKMAHHSHVTSLHSCFVPNELLTGLGRVFFCHFFLLQTGQRPSVFPHFCFSPAGESKSTKFFFLLSKRGVGGGGVFFYYFFVLRGGHDPPPWARTPKRKWRMTSMQIRRRGVSHRRYGTRIDENDETEN